MKKKLTYFAAVALVLAACSSEEPIAPPMVENDAMGANPYRVSLTDALKNADALLGELGEGETTRSVERKVESVEYYSRPGTRALGGDTLLYLVNYADDAGFALLSADSRLRPIYAISDEGSMSFSDTTYNKGLALFARGVEAELASLPSIQLPIDSLPEGPIINPEGTVTLTSQKSPMLGYHQSRWYQRNPYNIYCFTNDGRQAVVGCAAIAVGQIMSYYQHPTSYAGYMFDWEGMNAGTNLENIARLVQLLGNADNLRMNYGVSSSGAAPSRIAPTFNNMGYENPGYLAPFNENAVKTNLVENGPVFVGGYNSEEGHAWVIDGYKQYIYLNLGTGFKTYDDVLFHCVWGWGESSNGYFYWAPTNSLGGDPVERNPNDPISGTISDPYGGISYLGGFEIVPL